MSSKYLVQLLYISDIHIYFYVAISIDSTLCSNLNEELQESEETDCSPYEYDNLTSLVEEVCNTIFSLTSLATGINCVGM